MTYKKPDFEKIYKIQNAQVTDYCKITGLKKGKYGYNYQLKILVDDKIAKNIKKDADSALEALKKDYDMQPREFSKISKILKVKKNPDTGKVIEKVPCPAGKTLINLNTSAKEKNGLLTRIVHVFDAQNEPVEQVTIFEGSKVNVEFKIKSYTTNSGNGLSLILRYVQIVSLETIDELDPNSPFEKQEGGFSIKDIEDEYTEAEEIENDSQDDEEVLF